MLTGVALIEIFMQKLINFLSNPVLGGIGTISGFVIPVMGFTIKKLSSKNRNLELKNQSLKFSFLNYDLLREFDKNRKNYYQQYDAYAALTNALEIFDKDNSYKIRALTLEIQTKYSVILTNEEKGLIERILHTSSPNTYNNSMLVESLQRLSAKFKTQRRFLNG